MMRNLGIAAALGAAVLFPPLPASAACADRADLVAALARGWGEVPRFRALTADGLLFEIFLSPAGSWSVVATRPGGPACLVGAGTDGAVLPAPPAGEQS